MVSSAEHKPQRWRKWINGETGRRSDSAHSYLYPEQDKNANLQVSTGCVVNKVVFEYVHFFHCYPIGIVLILSRGTRAVGVEYIKDGKTFVAKASKQVLVCGGALGTPQIVSVVCISLISVFVNDIIYSLNARVLEAKRSWRRPG